MAVLRWMGMIVAILVAVLAVAFYILANHSVTQIALTCTGSWVRGSQGIQGSPETVFAVIEEYRPWIRWTDSHGNLRAESREIPLFVYFHHMRRIGAEPMVNYQFSEDSDGPMVGGYRGSFRELTLQFVDGTVFDGRC
jgi:hypothetical protein